MIFFLVHVSEHNCRLRAKRNLFFFLSTFTFTFHIHFVFVFLEENNRRFCATLGRHIKRALLPNLLWEQAPSFKKMKMKLNQNTTTPIFAWIIVFLLQKTIGWVALSPHIFSDSLISGDDNDQDKDIKRQRQNTVGYSFLPGSHGGLVWSQFFCINTAIYSCRRFGQLLNKNENGRSYKMPAVILKRLQRGKTRLNFHFSCLICSLSLSLWFLIFSAMRIHLCEWTLERTAHGLTLTFYCSMNLSNWNWIRLYFPLGDCLMG